MSRRIKAIKTNGYRSKFEASVAKTLAKTGVKLSYEPVKLPYVIEHTYCPDFVDVDAKLACEAKGRFDTATRTKMLAAKRDNPDWTFAFILQEPDRPIRKGSKTTARMWCLKHGFAVIDV
jgi:hypothetical protein